MRSNLKLAGRNCEPRQKFSAGPVDSRWRNSKSCCENCRPWYMQR